MDRLANAITSRIFLLLVTVCIQVQGCAFNGNDELTLEELEDFSELAALEPKAHSNLDRGNASEAESILHGMPSNVRTKGQASGIIYGTCVSDGAVDFLSKELDQAVLAVPDTLSQPRIGLDQTQFNGNQISFYVFDTLDEARKAELIVAKWQKNLKRREPAIFLSCDQANANSAPVIKLYAELYLNASKYQALAVGVAEVVGLLVQSPRGDHANVRMREWHYRAKEIIKDQPNASQAFISKSSLDMTTTDEELARSFAAFIVDQYGMQKAAALTTYNGKVDGFKQILGSDLKKVKTAWIKMITGPNEMVHRKISRR